MRKHEKPLTTDERELGMDREITRRDFVNSVAVGGGAALLAQAAPLAFGAQAAPAALGSGAVAAGVDVQAAGDAALNMGAELNSCGR